MNQHPYYPPPVYYPPPRGTNWAAVIAGLAALGIGSYAVYWLWQNGYFDFLFGCNEGDTKCIGKDLYKCENKKWVLYSINSPLCGGASCASHNNEISCESAGCYWYDGSCHSQPQGHIPCSELRPASCYPNVTGWRKCEAPYNNLCECDGTQWNLVEKESVTCIDNIVYNKCALNQDNMVICSDFYGPGNDECDQGGYGFGQGCPYGHGYCQPHCFPEPRTGLCIIKNQFTYEPAINALSSGMFCYDEGGSSYCRYDFKDEHGTNRPVAGTTLTGSFFYKWGPSWPGEWVDWAIFGVYRGEWRVLAEGTFWMSSPAGYWSVNANFAGQAIDSLVFGCGALVSNIHVDKFIGSLVY